MDDRCEKHPFEPAEADCDSCGWSFCTECLVYAFGPRKPPLCLSCALAKAGVRSNAGRRPARSKREMRKQQKENRKRLKEQAKHEPVTVAAPIGLEIPDDSSPAFDWADETPPADQGGNSKLVPF